MKLHYIITSIISISLLILGATGYLVDLGENYGETADLSSLNRTMERLEAQNANAQNLSDEITSFKLETVGDFFNIPYKMIKVGWSAAKTMFGRWTTVEAMMEDTADGLQEGGIPLPVWLVPSLVALMVSVLGAIIIYAFFKWKFEDK